MDQSVVENIQSVCHKVQENVGRVIVGKDHVVELAIIALLCEGHILIEDIPGIGKTTLAKSLARSLDCGFRRIQCTPDLLPSDITGAHIYNQRTSEFEYRPGPIMTQMVLADEINRATPRTQAALLEAMQERQVTTEGDTRPLPRPFMVMATQNPIELEGTFPLPEAQLDRFLIKIDIGYPTHDDDKVILSRFKRNDPLDELEPVVSADELLDMQTACRDTHISGDVEDYIIRIIHATRDDEMVQLGASPRAMLALYRTSQARAVLKGRTFVLPDDVKFLVRYVLVHRMIPKARTHLRGRSVEQMLDTIVDAVPVPVEEDASMSER